MNDIADTPTPAASAGPDTPDGIAEWRKKPVTITALRWTGDNLREVIAFTGRHPSAADWSWEHFEEVVRREGLKIFTLEGSHLATPGDYIIRGVKGEFYPCKPDIFALTYEPALRSLPREGEAVRFELRVDSYYNPGRMDEWQTFGERKRRDKCAAQYRADPKRIVETRDLYASPLPAPETGRGASSFEKMCQCGHEWAQHRWNGQADACGVAGCSCDRAAYAPPLPAGRPEEIPPSMRVAYVVREYAHLQGRNLAQWTDDEVMREYPEMASAVASGLARFCAALPAGRGSEVSEEEAQYVAKACEYLADERLIDLYNGDIIDFNVSDADAQTKFRETGRRLAKQFAALGGRGREGAV